MRTESEARTSLLTTIVGVLSETYTDAGVLIWLNAKNKQLLSKPDGNWTCSPAEYITAGHAAEVLECAQRIEGVSADAEDWRGRALRAETARDRLAIVVADLAEHGLRADLTPTMMFGDESRLYRQFCDYLARIEDSLRDRAQRALGDAVPPTTEADGPHRHHFKCTGCDASGSRLHAEQVPSPTQPAEQDVTS